MAGNPIKVQQISYRNYTFRPGTCLKSRRIKPPSLESGCGEGSKSHLPRLDFYDQLIAGIIELI